MPRKIQIMATLKKPLQFSKKKEQPPSSGIQMSEVVEGLLAKKHAKVKKMSQLQDEKDGEKGAEVAVARSQLEKDNKVKKHEKQEQRAATAHASRSKTWQSSLLGISDIGFKASDLLISNAKLLSAVGFISGIKKLN